MEVIIYLIGVTVTAFTFRLLSILYNEPINNENRWLEFVVYNPEVTEGSFRDAPKCTACGRIYLDKAS